MLRNGNDDGVYWSCVALSYLAHKNEDSIALFGETVGIFPGLLRALRMNECAPVACGVISQVRTHVCIHVNIYRIHVRDTYA